MEHKAEINRLQALRRFQSREEAKPRYYRTFKPYVKSPEGSPEQKHFFPDESQILRRENPELGVMLAELREGTEEVGKH